MDDTRRRNGRPTKPPAERRDARLPDLRVTAEERSRIEAAAARAGLSLSEFVRRAALGIRIDAKPPATTDKLVAELNRVGVNLNQIAARTNLTGEIAASFVTVLTEISAILERIAADDA